MAHETTVVTPERFQQGLSYQDFLAEAKVNLDQFARYYESAQDAISSDDIEFFKRAVQKEGGAARVLVLGADWCPDVFRGLPVMARVAEGSGMELQVFPRDDNLDIMNEFLNKGEFQSIPVMVFYNANQEYLCHWIERPVVANQEMTEIRERITQEMAGQDEQDIRRARAEATNARFPGWQRSTVAEWRELLAQTLSL